MNYQQKLNQEKLKNILNPKMSGLEFKITIRFKKCAHLNFSRALEAASKNMEFAVEGEGARQRYYASFSFRQVEEAYELFQYVKDFEGTVFFLNNKRIPYVPDLWLFLFWFYRVS